MKKQPYSNSRMFIEYILIAFSSYLLLSLVIALIGDYTYREVLASPCQMIGVFTLYWWVPIFRMVDMDSYNCECIIRGN